MQNDLSFNKTYGLKLRERFDLGIQISIFTSTLIFAVLILIVSNLDYSKMDEEADRALFSRYKAFVAELRIETEARITEQPTTPSHQMEFPLIQDEASKIIDEIINEPLGLSETNVTDFADIPGVQDLEERPSAIASNQLTGFSRFQSSDMAALEQPANVITNYEAGSVNDLIRKSFSYSITRQGEMSIKTTSELKEGPREKRGFRDQTEIERFVQERQFMIEYCFRKQAREVAGLHGYVRIQFKISYKGYVLPESIRILNSTIRNKQVEQCIKNYVKRWRNFRILDESMGIATVVQKFVYN